MNTQPMLRPPGRVQLLAAALVIVISLTVAVAVAGAASPTSTKGRIPDEAFRPRSGLDWSLVPDFVAASDQQGRVVGYVPRSALAGPAPADRLMQGVFRPAPIPVYGEDLTTVVGYMYPDKGFVPLGVDPNSVGGVPVKAGPGQ